jgi:hypothetical protein
MLDHVISCGSAHAQYGERYNGKEREKQFRHGVIGANTSALKA